MEYALPGYALVLTTLAVYAWIVIRRGRELSARVPEDQQRFFGDRS